MPTLKQLTASILHGHSTVPLKEYATTYTDGTVTTYIAIPTNPAGLPVPFSVKLTSNGYIAPGLAMFVFIDGVYQCNRNREDLVWDVRREIEMRLKGNGEERRGRKGRKAREKEEEERKERERERRARDVEFVVRQKEERGPNGTWVGRPWRFEEFRVVNAIPDLPDVDPQTHFAELGDIVVLVLRCVSKKDKPGGDSDSDSDAPRSAMAPSFDLDDSDSESNSEADIPTPKPSKGKDNASMQATVEDAPDEDLGGLGGLFGLFDGDNTGYYGQQYTYYPYQNGQQRNWEQQPWQAQNQQLQQWNAYTQQWEPVPTQYLQVPLQYNPGYTAQPQYVYYSAPEQHSQPVSAPAPASAPVPVSYHNHRCPSCGNTGPHDTSSQHRSSSACQSCGNPNPPSRSLSQHLHAQTQHNTVPLQSYTAPGPPPPPPPPPPQPQLQAAQQPQRHVHWADQQPQPPPIQAVHVPSTQPQPQPQPEQKRGPIVVPPRYFPGVPTYTYVPGQGYYHDHTRGGYVIEDGQKVYSECEECKKAAEERRKKKESEKGKGKKKKKKGKGEKHSKEGEKKDEEGKGKGGKKGGKKGNEKETKDDNQGGDTWGGGDQGGDTWGGGDSWGDNNQVDNSGENNGGNNDNWGDNNNNSGGWGDDNNDNNGGNGDNQDNSNSNWDSAPQPAPSPARTTGDPFASGGDPFRSQSHSRSNSRNRNRRDPSPPRSQHGGKPNPILTNPLEDADEFVTPMYRDPVPDEPPLYTVPENIAKERNLTHQVQMGRSLPYFHKIRTPRYLDTLEEPYARFVFKYRRKDVIENIFKVTVERDVEAERKILEALPREQIVETLLRTHGLLPTATPVKRLASRSRPASRSVSWNLNANNENNPNTAHTHSQTHANSSSHTHPQTAHTSPARNDTNRFAGALMDKLSAVSNEQGDWSSNNNNNNNGNSWDKNNATTSGDPFTSGGGGGGGGGGWKGNTAYNSPARPGSPAQEMESQW